MKLHRASLFFLISAVLFVVSLISLARGGYEKVWVQASDRHLTVGRGNVLDMWFSGDDRLIAVKCEGSRIIVERWNLESLTPMQDASVSVVDLSRELSEPALIPKSSRGSIQPVALVNNEVLAGMYNLPRNAIPFAVSPDGLSIAWGKGEQAWVRTFSEKGGAVETKEVGVKISSPVDSLVFVDDATIAVLPRVGELRSFNFNTGQQSEYWHLVDRPWLLWSRGAVLVASSSRSSFPENRPSLESSSETEEQVTDLLLMNLAGIRTINTRLDDLPGVVTAFGLSPDGHVVAGTKEGKLEYRFLDESVGGGVGENSAIRSISFDGDSMVVGGDFTGIYLFKASDLRKKRQLLDSPTNVHLVALRASRLAYATRTSAEVVGLEQDVEFTGKGNFVFGFFSLMVSVVALIHGLMIDKEWPRDRMFRFWVNAKQQEGRAEELHTSPLPPMPDQQGEVARQEPGVD